MKKTLFSPGLPITYFADSEGKALTTWIRGVVFNQYNERLEEAMKAVEEHRRKRDFRPSSLRINNIFK